MKALSKVSQLPTWSGDAVIKKPYRYLLQRNWNVKRKALGLIMLNPSTADAENNDATIYRAMVRAFDLGFGQLEVVNLFALRSRNPDRLYEHKDPIGPENNTWILNSAKVCDLILCAWGNHGAKVARGRDIQVISMLRSAGHKLHYLRLSRDGHPAHLLYLPYDLRPTEWSS